MQNFAGTLIVDTIGVALAAFGFLNPLLYGSLAGKGVINDITTGNNGSYVAKSGWDPCTGWGSPNGAKLLQALGS